jgi:hypothetical protein
MKLKREIAKLEDVAEGQRSYYRAEGNRFVLCDEIEIEMPDVAGLIAKRDELLATVARHRGVEDEYKTLKADKETRDTENAKKRGDWDALQGQMVEKHTAELRQRDERITALLGQVEARTVDAELTKAIAEAKGVPGLLLPALKPLVRLVEKDGIFTAQVVTETGTPRVADGKGTPFTVTDLVAEFKANELYGRAFEPSGAGGGGALKSTDNGGKIMTIPADNFDAVLANLDAVAKGTVKVA